MESFRNEMRYVVRRLVRAPLFTIIAITTLAVGIGANCAIFSVVNGVLLKPLPFSDPERLVAIWHKAPGLGLDDVNQGPAFQLVYQYENRVFEDVGMWRNAAASVTGLSEPERLRVLSVTDRVFPVLRVQAMLGRIFSAADDSPGSPATVILSYAYWQRRFGGDPGVIGRKIIVDGWPRDIIGVMPQNFRFLRSRPDLFLPYQLNRNEVMWGNFSHQGIARLKPSVTLEQANADVARMIPLVAERFPFPPGFDAGMLGNARFGPNLRPLKQDVVGDVGRILWVLLGTVAIVFLIACANVANLFLVRSDGRQRELAIRTAMGGSSWRVARELLTESVTLGIASGIVGVFLAYAGLRVLTAKAPATIPRLEEIDVDPLVLLFTFGISIVAGLLFGVIPVVKYARPNPGSALKEGGRTFSEGKERHRARNVLVVCQIALALVLLISSGLMMRTFQALRKVQPGFVRPEEVLTVRMSIPATEVADTVQMIRTHEQILRRIEQVPGVTSVGLSSSITMDGNDSNDPVFFEDFPAPVSEMRIRRYKWTSGNYFETMGNPVLAGRTITWDDVYNKARVAVLTENLARLHYRNPSDAIGRRIRESPKAPWREIIGVVGNEYDDGVNQSPVPTVYWPVLMDRYWGGDGAFAQRTLSYAIRSKAAGSTGFFREVQQAVWSVNRNLPLANVRRLDQILEDSMARTSFTLLMLGIAAAVALLLGIVGIYGVISYIVSQRRREIGIRIALGAQRAEVSGIFVRQGLVLTCVGVGLGCAAAVALTRMMSSLLFGVSAMDPVTYGAVSVGLGAIAMLASYLPARRASGVDPIEALRWE